MLSFERGKSIKRSLNIGLASKRDFNSLLEAAKWALNFPDIITEGNQTEFKLEKSTYSGINPYNQELPTFFIIQDFNNSLTCPIIDQILNGYRLYIVKWIRYNITILNQEIILKEAKNILELMQILLYKGLNYFDDQLTNNA